MKAFSNFSAKKRQAEVEIEKKVDDEIDLDEALMKSVRSDSVSDSSGSAKNSISRPNRIYEHIKREIVLREKNKPAEECEEEVFFVDNQRNAAVVIGTQDLKADVKDKSKRERSINCCFLRDKIVRIFRQEGK